MAHQPRHHGDQRRVRLLGKSEGSLQGCLAHGLAGRVCRRVMRRKRRVGRRVVGDGVDAVDHAVHFPADGVHHALQPLGIGRVMELGGVGGTDGGDGVRHEHGTLHQVHVAVHAEGAVIVPATIQTEELVHAVAAVAALILNVVNGEHRADMAYLPPAGGRVLEIDGHQRRLPVVAVEDVRHPVQAGQQVDDRVAEKGEALAVVKLTVQAAAAEVFFVVHEVPGHAPVMEGEQAAVLMPPAQVHVDIPAEGHFLPPLGADLVVQGQDDGGLDTLRRQGGGEAAGHIGQAAGLAEGIGFAGHIQQLHGRLLSLTPSRPWR